MPSRSSGMTLKEVNFAIAILVVLIFVMVVGFLGTGPAHDGSLQLLSNMKQLHLATQQMALDSETTGDTNLGWPGDTGGTFTNWAHNLTAGGYLSTNDLCKLLSGPGRITPPGTLPRSNNNATLVYNVSSNSVSNTVFLTSANFTNTPTGGVRPLPNAKPYGDRGFAILRKAGDGAILQPKQAGQTNLVGSFVPLCR